MPICYLCQKPVPKTSGGKCRACIARASYKTNKNYNSDRPESYYREAREKAKKYWAYLN
jgi:hypothetical protein